MRSDVSPDRDTDRIDRVQDYTGENVNADTFLKVLAGHQVCPAPFKSSTSKIGLQMRMRLSAVVGHLLDIVSLAKVFFHLCCHAIVCLSRALLLSPCTGRWGSPSPPRSLDSKSQVEM